MNLCGYRGIDRDITKRKQVEEELEKHRAHLKELVKERTKKLTLANEQLKIEIKERKKIAKALRIAEKEKAVVLNSILDLVIYRSLDKKIIWAIYEPKES